MKIPFGTISITEKSIELINESLAKGRISSGRLVYSFEKKFAGLVGVKEAVAVSSGTDALVLAMAVLYDIGAERGDEIIVPALSFVATGNAVLQAGFTPVFVDILPDTLNIDPDRIEHAITPRTRAILPVHLMGKPAAMNQIKAIAAHYNLRIIEDAAEAHGGVYHGNNIGTLGDMAAYSLYVAHIITTGEGGIITTDNSRYAEILRSLRAHGRACKCKECVSNISSGYCEKRFNNQKKGDIRFLFERVGYSSKMNELEAALGLGCLDHYDEILSIRHHNLMNMITQLNQFSEYFMIFAEESHETIGPHAFPFVLREDCPFKRDELMVHLEENGIDTRTLFSSIPTQCGGYEFLGYKPGDFPFSEYVGLNGIHIGVHQDITDGDVEWFLEKIALFIKKNLKR